MHAAVQIIYKEGYRDLLWKPEQTAVKRSGNSPIVWVSPRVGCSNVCPRQPGALYTEPPVPAASGQEEPNPGNGPSASPRSWDEGSFCVRSTRSAREEGVPRTEGITHFQLSQMLASENKPHNSREKQNGKVMGWIFTYSLQWHSHGIVFVSVAGSKIFIVLSVLWNGVSQDGSVRLTGGAMLPKRNQTVKLYRCFFWEEL